MTRDLEKEAAALVDGALAETRLEAIRSYLERGRKLKEHSTHELEAEFVEAQKIWADQPTDRTSRRRSDDAIAEHDLRKMGPPYHLVSAEIDRVAKAAALMMEDDDTRARVRESFEQDLLKRPN